MVKFSIKGPVAPVFVPINEDNTIVYDVIPGYLKYLTGNGIDTVLVSGTSGEASCLSTKERMLLTEAWLKACMEEEHPAQVIVQVGAAPLPDVLKMASHAEASGAAAILCLPELYFKPRSADELVVYLARVAAAAPTLPLLYYHFPMMSGVNINVKQFFKLATSRIPTFSGMKADLAVALQVADQIVDGQQIFMANHVLAPAALMGYTSSIATVTNLFPGLVKDILAAVISSDFKLAKKLQEELNGLVDAISSQGDWVSSMKVGMEYTTGVRVGSPRPPVTSLTDTQKRIVYDNLEKMGIQRIL